MASLRIGIVGGGRVAQGRHIPGLRRLPEVEIVGLCSRRRESSSRVARALDIPRTYPGWEDLVEDEEVEAVVVATWPDLHAPVTLAALDAGKHVLTQNPMAMNAREAQRMVDKAAEKPHLVAMVAPGPYGIACGPFVSRLIRQGWLGALREAHVTSFAPGLSDRGTGLDWGQVTRHVGFNMLDLAAIHQASSRWTSQATRVLALASKLVRSRRSKSENKLVKVGTPDTVQVLVTYENDAVGTFRASGLSRGLVERQVQLFGTIGTIVVDLVRDEIMAGKGDQAELKSIPIPPDYRGHWSIESDFVAAIRGESPPAGHTFAAASRQMQFVEAVARSSRHQEPVFLPLQEFSNPSL